MVKATYVENGVRKGAWTAEEDHKLRAYVKRYGHWNWRLLPKFAGLDRCGKSCRLRWVNYLKPGVRRGGYTQEEARLIAELHHHHGNKWSMIATKLVGRTDNDIKNYWHAHLKNVGNTTTTTTTTSTSNKSAGSDSSSYSNVLILESSSSHESNSSTAVPTAQSSMDQSCSSTVSSVTAASMADNVSVSLASCGFDDHDDMSFWSELPPFMVHSNPKIICGHEGDLFSPLFYKWLNDANCDHHHM